MQPLRVVRRVAAQSYSPVSSVSSICGSSAGGAWAEWEIENIEMCVPLSPEELRAKRNSILKHQSQMESAPFLGNDERLFWQRAEDRNRATASLYDQLGLACYEAMEAFVEYKPL